MRLIRELSTTTGKPAWCIFENVAGHINLGLDEVLSDLEGEGYACWPFVIPACALNAPHRRDRVWVIAHTNSKRCKNRNRNIKSGNKQSDATHTNSAGLQAEGTKQHIFRPTNFEQITEKEWTTEPPVCGPDDGIPDRVARLKALGNSVVPQIPELIGRMILSAQKGI